MLRQFSVPSTVLAYNTVFVFQEVTHPRGYAVGRIFRRVGSIRVVQKKKQQIYLVMTYSTTVFEFETNVIKNYTNLSFISSILDTFTFQRYRKY